MLTCNKAGSRMIMDAVNTNGPFLPVALMHFRGECFFPPVLSVRIECCHICSAYTGAIVVLDEPNGKLFPLCVFLCFVFLCSGYMGMKWEACVLVLLVNECQDLPKHCTHSEKLVLLLSAFRFPHPPTKHR